MRYSYENTKFIKKIISPIIRYRDNRWESNLRNRLVCDEFTLLSSNCMAGVIYHRLGLKFNSPTIDTLSLEKDFIKFVSNLDYYLSMKLEFIETDEEYPVAMLGDVKIHFVHYHSREEAENKWNERKKRIIKDRLFLIMFDVDIEKDDILRFGEVNCRNKNCLSEKWDDDISFVKLLKRGRFDSNKRFMDKNFLLRRRFEEQWDFADWINKGFNENI